MKELSALRVCVALAIVAVTLLGVPAHAADKVKVSYPTMTSSYIFFFSAISKLVRFGPRNEPFPRLPKVPSAGSAKFEVLSQGMHVAEPHPLRVLAGAVLPY